MPTLPASGYPYVPYPTETANVGQATPYQQISSPAAAFGASQGQALERLGGAFEQAGNRLESVAIQRQQLFNQIAADDQTNQVEDRVNKILYGDPDLPGDTGFMGKRGRQAMDAFPVVRGQIDKIIQESRKTLQNPQQALRFDESSRRFRLFTFGDIGRHYDREFNQYAADTATARLKLGETSMARAASANDFGGFKQALGMTLGGIESSMQAIGAPPEKIEAAKQAATQKGAVDWAQTLMTRDPVAARQFVEANAKHFGDKYDDMLRQTRAAAADRQATEDALGIKGAHGTPNLIRGGALSPGRLDEMRQTAEAAGFRGEAATTMAAIAAAESGGNSNAIGDRDLGGSYGITQIHEPAHGPVAREALGNDKRAMELAFQISKGGTDFTPWTMYKNGGYRQFLPVTSGQPPTGKGPDQLVLPPPEEGQLPDDQVPGLPDRMADLAKRAQQEGWDPTRTWNAVKRLRQMANVEFTSQRQQQQVAVQKQKQTDEAISNQMIARLPTDNPPTLEEIAVNPQMSAEAKRTMTNFVHQWTKPEPAARMSAINQMELFRRIHLPDNDPEKIWSERTIDEAYAPGGKVTWTAREQLIKDFRESQDASTKDLTKRQADLLKVVTPKLVPAAAYGMSQAQWEMIDPTAHERLLMWNNAVKDKIKEYRDAGKNPRDLFIAPAPGQSKPEYVGSPEFLAQPGIAPPVTTKFGLGKPTTGPTDPSTLKTLPEIMQARRENKITIEQARQRAIEIGAAAPDAAPTPALEVPVR